MTFRKTVQALAASILCCGLLAVAAEKPNVLICTDPSLPPEVASAARELLKLENTRPLAALAACGAGEKAEAKKPEQDVEENAKGSVVGYIGASGLLAVGVSDRRIACCSSASQANYSRSGGGRNGFVLGQSPR